MKLEWIQTQPIVRKSNKVQTLLGVPLELRKKIGLGQVVDERGGITIPPWYVAGNLIGTVAGAYHGYKRGGTNGGVCPGGDGTNDAGAS